MKATKSSSPPCGDKSLNSWGASDQDHKLIRSVGFSIKTKKDAELDSNQQFSCGASQWSECANFSTDAICEVLSWLPHAELDNLAPRLCWSTDAGTPTFHIARAVVTRARLRTWVAVDVVGVVHGIRSRPPRHPLSGWSGCSSEFPHHLPCRRTRSPR